MAKVLEMRKGNIEVKNEKGKNGHATGTQAVMGKQAVKPAGQPAEKPAEKPAGQPAEKPAEKPAGQPAEKPAGQPAEKPAGQPAEKPAEAVTPAVVTGYSVIPIDLLDPNPYQPRKHFDEVALEELSKSIKQSGLLQHPVVRKVGERYQIIAGERRTRAVKLLGWKELGVNLVVMTDAEVATAALVENLQRQDVSQLSTAKAIDRMITEFGMKQGQMAKDLGVTQAKVSQMLVLLKLADPLLEALEKGDLSSSVGRIVGTLDKKIQVDLMTNL